MSGTNASSCIAYVLVYGSSRAGCQVSQSYALDELLSATVYSTSGKRLSSSCQVLVHRSSCLLKILKTAYVLVLLL
jgi:hypothetical protein